MPVANSDAKLDATVSLVLPQGWKAEPQTVPVSLRIWSHMAKAPQPEALRTEEPAQRAEKIAFTPASMLVTSSATKGDGGVSRLTRLR